MAGPSLGGKHICSECGCKFYDLGKANPVCPQCGSQPAEAEDTKAKA